MSSNLRIFSNMFFFLSTLRITPYEAASPKKMCVFRNQNNLRKCFILSFSENENISTNYTIESTVKETARSNGTCKQNRFFFKKREGKKRKMPFEKWTTITPNISRFFSIRKSKSLILQELNTKFAQKKKYINFCSLCSV